MYEGIEVAVYAAVDMSLIDVVSRRWEPRFLDELNRDGGGSFRIRADDPSLTDYPMLLAEGNLVKHTTDAGQVFWWEILRQRNVQVAAGEFSGEWIEVSGPGVRSWFNHAVVYPEYGIGQAPRDRAFNFAAKQGSWYTPADWVPATQNNFVRVSPYYVPGTPSQWPATLDAFWIWDRPITSLATVHPDGDCYFRHEFTLATAMRVKLYATADNYGIWLVDGAKVIEATEPESWRKAYTAEIELGAGPHVLAVRARNVGAFAGIAYAMVQTRASTDGKDVVYTNNDVVIISEDAALVRSYPAVKPGWTVGQILNTLLDEAIARGVPSIGRLTRTWTDAVDSNGVAWAKSYDMVFSLGTSYSDVLTQISDSYGDVWFDGLAMNVAQTRGVDRSVSVGGNDPVTFRAGLSVLGAKSESVAEITNTAVVKTPDGLIEVAGPGGSVTQFGRRESFVTTSGSMDGVAQALVDQMFSKYATPRRTPTLEILPTAGCVPWVDFKVGDWVLAPNDLNTGLIKRRIVSISVEEDDDTGEVLYSAEIDTIQMTTEERLARWLQSVDNGSKQGGVSGTSSSGVSSATSLGAVGYGTGSVPLQDSPSPSNPAAPTNITVSTDVYIDELKKYRGKATVGWAHTGKDVDGRPMVPAAFEIAYKITGSSDAWKVVGQTDGTSTVVAPLGIYKADLVTAENYTFVVRARGDNGRTSDWSQAVSVAMVKDTTAPDKPYFVQANVTTWLMTVKIAWGGKLTTTGSNQLDPPADFDKVFVYQDTQASMATQVKIGEIPAGQGFVTVPAATAGQQLWFRLAAVDASGNVSAYSDIKTITPTANVNIALITDKIDAAITALTNIPTNSLADQAITSAKIADNAVQQVKLEQLIRDNIDKGVTALTNQTGINSSITALQTSVSGKNTITNSTASASGSGVTSGDRWQKWTTLSAGGKLTATWRWNGSAWIAELIDPVYIPQIDIGAGTFGSFDGGRLTAATVRTNALLVSDLINFAPSPAESPGDWTMTGGMAIVATALDECGYRFNATENTATAWANGPMMAVKPGQTLYATGKVYRNNVGTATNVFLRYYWYDKDKVGLTSPVYTGSAQSSTSGSGAKFELTATVPAGAAYAQYRIPITATTGVGSGTSTGFYAVDGFRQSSAVMIQDGAVTADKVVTNGLTAKQILIGDFANLAVGSDFEDPTAVPWTLHADHTISTTQKKSGTSSLKMAAGTGNRISTFIGDLRVKEGEQWVFRMHAYIDATFNGDGNSKLRISDQTGSPVLGAIAYNGITRSAWTSAPLETTVTVPAGVTSLTVGLWNNNTAGLAYIDDIQIRRVSEASLIMNLGVEKLVANAAFIDTAVVDKFYAEVVRSRRIGTDLLLVGRGVNGIVDEFFDATDLNTYRDTLAGGWGGWGRNTTVNLNWYGGSLTAGTSRSFFYDTVATYDKTSYIPVETGQVWRFNGQYTSATSGPRATARLIYKDGTTAYTSAGWTANSNGTGTNAYGAAGTLLTLQRYYTVPANVAYIMPALQFEAPCTTAYVYGGATVTNMANPALLVDGSIAALKIDTNDLSSDTGFIGSMRTNILTTDWVKAVNIDATQGITSRHTITGATFQTSGTASRGIKITSSSLKAYSSTGVNTFTLDGATGNMVATGTMQTSAAGARVLMWDRLDGTAAVDMYADGTGQHGSIYTQPQAGNGGYVTNVMHYTGTPITSSNWTARMTLFADETWSIDQKTHAAEITGDTNGRIYVRGQFLKNNSAVTETFVVGSTVTSALATGSYTLTYATPVTQGTRHVLATADSATVAQSCTQNCTASGFKWVWSTTASSSISMRYWAVWTD
jgi:hypothetical protein